MKTILLKEAVLSGQTEPTTTQQLVKLCLDTPPEGGFKYKDYKERARIENAMDKIRTIGDDNRNIEECFELEDKDFENLGKYANNVQWASRDPFVFEFLEQFNI